MSKQITVSKGQLLSVKVPPYYEKEYVYEVISAGQKQVRAQLKNSPKVRKSWTGEEFALLLEMGMLKLIASD